MKTKKQSKWTSVTKQKQSHRYRNQQGCQRGKRISETDEGDKDVQTLLENKCQGYNVQHRKYSQ